MALAVLLAEFAIERIIALLARGGKKKGGGGKEDETKSRIAPADTKKPAPVPGQQKPAPPQDKDIDLKYKKEWTAEQRAEADRKVKHLSENETVVTESKRSGTSASTRYKKAGNTVPKGKDVDHAVDLQLGGSDTISNMSPLDPSVNRSLGRQIQHKIKDLPPGTKINKVTIGD